MNMPINIPGLPDSSPEEAAISLRFLDRSTLGEWESLPNLRRPRRILMF